MVRRLIAVVIALGVALLPATANAGTGWQIVPSPNSGTNDYNNLESVSCPSATNCSAAGYYGQASTTLPLIEHWNGSSWSTQTVPHIGANDILYSIKCVSASSCMAVGAYGNPNRMLAEHWNGTTWKILPIANPSGISNVPLDAVACTTASNCIALGQYTSGPNFPSTDLLAEHWNGTSWKSQIISTPAGTSSGYLNSISCTSATACTAVGYDGTSTGIGPLVERWNGTSWKTQQPPNLPPGDTLNSVKCNSGTSCIAVGFSEFAVWNGSTWTAGTVPGNNRLDAISCTSATACTAVGWTSDFSSLVAMYWNGTTWVNQAIPSPPGTATLGANLWSVSCTSATSCTAVGRYFTSSSGAASTLVEQEQL
jgi:hypothetical protein